MNSITRIALLSDIHGNSIALDAVFEDIKHPASDYIIKFMRGQMKPAWYPMKIM